MKRSKSEVGPLVINTHPINYRDNTPHSASEAALSRSFSDYFDIDTPHNAYVAYQIALDEYDYLTRSLRSLQREVDDVAEKADEWKLKYSSRFVFVSNGLVALYLLSRRLLDLFNDNYTVIIRYLLNPAGWFKLSSVSKVMNKLGISSQSQKVTSAAEFKRKYVKNLKLKQKSKQVAPSWRMHPNETFNSFLMRALWPQVFRCAMFVFSGYWLMKHEHEDWKRDCGFVIALVTNIYEAIESDSFNFGIYLNMLALSIYLAARYLKSIKLEENMDRGEEWTGPFLFDDNSDEDFTVTPATPLSANTTLRRTWSSHFQTRNTKLGANHYRNTSQYR
jgi:hypothetical protein